MKARIERGYVNKAQLRGRGRVRLPADQQVPDGRGAQEHQPTCAAESHHHPEGPEPAEVVRLGQRPLRPSVIAQLKSGVTLRGDRNWAYMDGVEAVKSWLAMMMHLKADRRKYAAMEFRRFIREMILLPCQVIRRARQTTLRIIGWQPTTDRLFSAWRTIERTGFG